MQISIISASTRLLRRSHTVSLFLEKEIAARGHLVEILDLAAYRLPVFEEILSKQIDPPAALVAFAATVRASDAIIFVSPEYNGGYTSALKNAVDYLKDQEFAKKPIGTVAVSSGAMGGIRAALAMQELVLGVGGFALPQMMLVGEVGRRFGEDGELLDASFQPKVNGFLDAFLWISEAVFEKKQAISIL